MDKSTRSRRRRGQQKSGAPDALSRTRRALLGSIQQAEELQKRLREAIVERDAAMFGSGLWLKAVFQHAPAAMFTLDRDKKVIDWNPAAERLFGYTRAEVIGRTHPLINDENRKLFESNFGRMLEGHYFRSHESRCRRKDGEYVDVSFSNVPLFDERGRILGMTGILVDRSELRSLADRLRILALTVEHSPSLVFITDRAHVIQYANTRFLEITGYERGELIGRKAEILKSGATPPETMAALRSAIESETEFRGELVNKRRNGTLYTADCHIAPIRDDAGAVTHFVCHQEDISEVRELRAAVSFHSSHDPLTGLANRTAFEHELSALVTDAAGGEQVHAVAYIDIDQAELIAAKYGLDAINDILRRVAERIGEETRRSDFAARVGDDEFGILIRFCRPQQGERVAASLLNAVHALELKAGEDLIRPTISIGLAPIDRESENAAAVLADARSACNLAKKRGRNCFVTLEEVDGEVKQRRAEMEWTARVARAIEENRLFLVWQAIAPIGKPGALLHYEVLVRMRDENGEVIMPGTFLPAVEKHGFSQRLDTWVIGTALDWLHRHPETLERIGLCALNLSGDSVGDAKVRDFILRRIRELGIPGDKLCFEITETAAVNNFSEARRFILALKELGCRFAIDDFGSGVSSFGYLKHLPVDILKIDGSFVRHITENELDAVLVKSMNDVGHVMGKQTVAEFVENEAILNKLGELGVDFAQGYAVGRPVPLALPA